MKKFFMICLLFFIAACSSGGAEEINGKTPDQVAVEWVGAQIKSDYKLKAQLLTAEERNANKNYLDKQIARGKSHANRKLDSHYRLTEWKFNDSTFYYLAEYKHPVAGWDKEQVKIVKTKEGWKVANLVYPKDFEERTRGIEPKVIKEVAQQ